MVFSNSKPSGQGTIEYLVILAIMVVISLVVVALLTSLTNTSDVSKNTKKIESYSSSISIVEAAMDSNGDAIFVARSNLGNDLVLSKINVNGTEVIDSTNILQITNSKIQLSNIATSCCRAGDIGDKDCNVTFYYSTPYLDELSTSMIVHVECVNDIIPKVVVPVVVPYVCTNLAPFENGNGTISNPYGICNWAQLNEIRNHLDANFILLSDLSASTTGYAGLGNAWTPIGVIGNSFRGNLNGNKHTISKLIVYLPSTNRVGLFGTFSGSISDLGLVDVNVQGGDYYSGAIVGYSSGSILRSYSTGFVKGNSYYVGGLVGSSSGVISNSYSDANAICPFEYVGGLTGDSSGSIINSYSTGLVSGYLYLGGLVGANSGTITSSYYDSTTSGQSDVGKGQGKVTSEMKQQSTYVGWDFGTVWNILSGHYPNLQ
jgi:hypothetical protein